MTSLSTDPFIQQIWCFLFINDARGLLGIITEEKASDGSFMVLCFCLSDVSYWKHGGEAGELQCPETWGQWTSTVSSIHVQLQSASQRPAREPPEERQGALYLQVTVKLIMAAFPKISPSNFKGPAVCFGNYSWLDD